jgi:hypothetical protein
MPDRELIARLEEKKAKLLAHVEGVDQAIAEAEKVPDQVDVVVTPEAAEGAASVNE